MSIDNPVAKYEVTPKIPVVISLAEEREDFSIGTLNDPWATILVVAIIIAVILLILLIILAVSRNNQTKAKREVYELRRDIEVRNTGLGNDIILIKEKRPYVVGYKKATTDTPVVGDTMDDSPIVGYKEKSNYIE